MLNLKPIITVVILLLTVGSLIRPVQSSSHPIDLRDGFTADCYNLQGVDYRANEWDRDGYSGQLFRYVYKGGDHIRETEALFPYVVSYISDTAIVGTGTYGAYTYLISLNRDNGEVLYSRVSAGGIASVFAGKCSFFSG